MQSIKKLVRKLVPQKLISLIEQAYRGVRGVFWILRYGYPTRGMKVIAVTGTNGKTTTASFINEVLKAGGKKTAILTTAYQEVAGKYEDSPTTYTLQKQSIVQEFFSRARQAEVDWVILEVTSHALDQKRILGVPVKVAVITNLSQEHLDYHKTMENYAAAKARLVGPQFKPKWSVINADNEWFDFFAIRNKGKLISFGKKPEATLQLTNYKLSAEGAVATAEYRGKVVDFEIKLVGEFNLYNALAACGVGLAVELEPDVIAKGLESLKAVPGRMEKIDEGQDFDVLVDYAVTPDALENALKTLQQITKNKVLVVFGATGDRDKTKREPLGEVAAKHADLIFLTDDETYTEDPASIREAVYEGVKKGGGARRVTVYDDRKDAIKEALKAAKKGDMVLITGMGHEDHRNLGGKLVPWNERKIVRNLLKK